VDPVVLALVEGVRVRVSEDLEAPDPSTVTGSRITNNRIPYSSRDYPKMLLTFKFRSSLERLESSRLTRRHNNQRSGFTRIKSLDAAKEKQLLPMMILQRQALLFSGSMARNSKEELSP